MLIIPRAPLRLSRGAARVYLWPCPRGNLPYDAEQWALLIGGALLILGCLIRGL